ncbi:MAG: hypothetical protein JWN83_3008 [Chitinophagaceae bacterium]|nr:hypothetical protein [Chitinophagaceae bacterium]
MTTLKFITFLLFIGLCSCGQQPAKYKANPEAVRLNNQIIPLIRFTDNPDSCRKALLLLDSATAIDSNNFLAYDNKLMFLYGLKQYDKAILTVNELLRLRPNAHDLFMMKGNLYEIIGDTISSKSNFQKALTICNSVLDTMSTTNRDYVMLTTNKAINLIMLGDLIQANKILKNLYDTQPDDSAFDNVEKKYILSLMNKNKTQLMETISNPDKNSR